MDDKALDNVDGKMKELIAKADCSKEIEVYVKIANYARQLRRGKPTISW